MLKIPCKYPEKGPMMYEMMEYCAELTRQREAARQNTTSRTTSSRDTFLYPRGWDEGEQEPQADPHAHLTEAERETLWLRVIEERTHRRRRIVAGYDPDMSKGVRRIRMNVGDSDDSDNEAPPAQAEASAALPPNAASAKPAPGPEAQAEAPAPRRYGVVMREVADGAAPAAATVSHVQLFPGEVLAAEVPAAEVLRRVFARDHPGVAAMTGWLEEEGVHTAAQLGAVLAGGSGTKGGAAALRDIGFRPEWATAAAAGFARAAAAAEKAASNS